MKLQIGTGSVMAGLALLALGMFSSASAAVIVLVKKTVDAKSNLEFHYQYTCVNGVTGTLMVNATDEVKAQQLAEVKAKRVCEE